MSGTALGENKMAIPKREESYNEIFHFLSGYLIIHNATLQDFLAR